MRQKYTALAVLAILAGVFLPHLACKSSSLVPVSPGGRGLALNFTMPVTKELQGKLLGTPANQIFYKITGAGIAPLSGSTVPFGTAGNSGEVSFTINAPQGTGELLSFELTNALNNQLLAVGAVKTDVEPGGASDLFVTMGTMVSPCYTVDSSSNSGNAFVDFQNDIVGSSAGVSSDLRILAVPSGSVTNYKLQSYGEDTMAFMGNGNLVNFAAIPETFPLAAGNSSSALNAGDVYCLKIPGSTTLYAWVQVVNPKQYFGTNPPGPQGPLLRFRVSNLPYFGYYQTTADLAVNCYVPPATPTPIGPSGSTAISTYAGSGANGSSNGVSLSSSFNYPSGLAVDGSGNFYVADTFNNKIRKIDSSGNVTTLAGSGALGSNNGSAATASFFNPCGVAVDSTGTTVFVADTNNDEIRMIIDGQVFTLAGSAGVSGHTNAQGTAASFNHPVGLALDPSGTTLYIADTANDKIRAIDSSANVTTFAGNGTQGFLNTTNLLTSEFYGPLGVAVDGLGNVYVADGLNRMIREISGGIVTTLAGTGANGSANGSAGTATFAFLVQLAVDGSGNVFAVDTPNNVVREISGGNVTTLAGSGTAGFINGPANVSQFNYPEGLALYGGNVYVTDTNNFVIRKIIP